jgi:hypothetical protein
VTPASVPAVLGTTVGPQGADRAQLLAWLDGLALPWLPATVVVAGLLAGVSTVRHRGERPRDAVVRACGQVAAVAAVSAVGVVAAAVLGDGYFEIAKHVWLAAYLLVVTAAAVLLGVAVMVARRTFSVLEPRKSPARAA